MYNSLNKLDATYIQLANGDIVTADIWNNLNSFYIEQSNYVIDAVNLLQAGVTLLEERCNYLGIYYGADEAPDWAHLQIVPDSAVVPNYLGGIYVGSGEMPEHCNVQLDPDAEPTAPETLVTRSTAKVTFLGSRKIDGNQDLGLSCVLQENGKCYIFDLGNDTQPLIDFINDPENNITSIDGIIISHFHTDHIGGTEFVNGNKVYTAASFRTFLTVCKPKLEYCTFYLPHQVDNRNYWTTTDVYGKTPWNKIYNGSNVVACATKFLQAITDKLGDSVDVIAPNEDGYTIAVSKDLSITFYNVSESSFSSYFNDHTDCAGEAIKDKEGNEIEKSSYNNWSMVSIIEHCNNKIAITGDIERPAQDALYTVFHNVDVLQIEHHNENYVASKKYLKQLHPKIAVIPEINDTYYQNSNTPKRLNPTVDKVLAAGGSIYSTGGEYDPTNQNITIPQDQHVVVVSTERDVCVSYEHGRAYRPFQSFGVGGIVERVTSGNTRYKKYADGTFDLYGTITNYDSFKDNPAYFYITPATEQQFDKNGQLVKSVAVHIIKLPFEISSCAFLGTQGTTYGFPETYVTTVIPAELVKLVNDPNDTDITVRKLNAGEKTSDTLRIIPYNPSDANDENIRIYCRFHMFGTYR